MSQRIVRWCLVALAAAVAVTALAQQRWRLYQFHDNEHFRYTLERVEDGQSTEGHYVLTIRPAGGGRLVVEVDGKLAEAECSSSATVDSAEMVSQQMMMGCMTMAEAATVLHTPVWGFFMSRDLSDGTHWSMSDGDETLSFSIEGSCSHAGRTGKRAVTRRNDVIHMQACVDTDTPLPLAVMFKQDDGNSVEMKLVEYRRL